MAASIDTTLSFVTSLDDVLRYLGQPAGEHDGVLIALVNHTARLFEELTGRKLKERAHAGVFVDGTGEATMLLPQYPVDRTATFTVHADSSREFAATALLTLWDESTNAASAQYLLREDVGEIERLDGDLWPLGTRTVKVTYTAGIKLANAGHLIRAQLAQVAAWWNERGKELTVGGGQAGISESLAGDPGWRRLVPYAQQVVMAEREFRL